MAMLTVEGTYRDGRVELGEIPIAVESARVLVTFLPTGAESSAATRKEMLRRQFLARLQRGVDFGTEPLPTREGLYAQRTDRYQ